ncbi:MAG: peptidoglycan-binding protein LysM [Saprospiraceae bacterium]|nr:peptidoglycan-binding protein LysM [Saprospiraceae bacterium]
MGLFSFLKKAGSGILKNDAEANAAKAEAAKAKRIELLKSIVESTGLEIENLDIEVADDQVTVYGQVDSQSDKEKVVLVLGNVEGIASVDDRISVVNPEPEAVFYEVQSGDSLSKIAKAHYGDAMKYMLIFEANQPLLKDPNLIYPGQVLRIPSID